MKSTSTSIISHNGRKFTDTGSNIISIDINADGMLDVQQSYLEFQLQWYGDKKAAMDQGHAWTKRLTIESAGKHDAPVVEAMPPQVLCY